MQKKLVPIGTTLRGKVSVNRRLLLVIDGEDGEGYVLVGVKYDPNLKEGDHGTLEFCAGGPMGGHWKFTPD